jgi:hypothetical protein
VGGAGSQDGVGADVGSLGDHLQQGGL